MASSSNKPTAVHYSLIIAVMFVIGLLVAVYQIEKGRAKAVADKAAADKKFDDANKGLQNAIDDLEALKKQSGKVFDVINDKADPANANTVYGSLQKDLDDYGKTEKESTISATLAKMRSTIDTINAELRSKEQALADAEREKNALQQRYSDIAAQHQNAFAKAEGEKRGVISERDEKLAAKDRTISEIKAEIQNLRVELEAEKDARDKERKKLQEENLRLTAINDKLRSELDDIKKESFEVGDGYIARVENAAHLVWINLGEADFLKPRMTFSVYGKDTPGVGRTSADVKGKIEVTRILDQHLAEAKITDEDLFRPMSAGDIVYTPLWSPGRTEKFAIVGNIDLDADGVSDRVLFRQEIAVRGAELAVEVDDNGDRIPEDAHIDENIKFFILGAIPDESKLAAEEDQKKAKKIGIALSEMDKEARLHGVRTITLSDFLNYIGYKPKRRLFKPGEDRPYTLKAGAASTATNQPLGDIGSSGQVSGSYSKSKSMPAQNSGGATSKLFGGK